MDPDPVGNWGVTTKGKHPITCVNWAQAKQYCTWLGAGYDLPTEAQWEMAARGDCLHNGDGKSGSKIAMAKCASNMRVYPWGSTPAPTYDYANFDAPVGPGCGAASTAVAGSRPKGAGPYGTRDQAGNTWEWVIDRYDATFYATSATPVLKDPVNVTVGVKRVLRGGGWSFGASGLRGSSRGNAEPTAQFVDLGFRCVR